ncbi:hypothetical protein [Pantoea trifolii]|uniref:hypothetical protein n=1 Tax=Pantoea trifolii TaxID=2968030 RepID=UPI003F51253A
MPGPLAIQLFGVLQCLAEMSTNVGRMLARELLTRHVFMYSSFWLRLTAFMSHN